MKAITLTAGQKAQLRELLELRLHDLDRRIAAHQGAGGRVAHAREVLLQDGDDAPQRDSDREVDLALTDAQMRELRETSAALARLNEDGYGLCVDCNATIPFDRLRVEPWARRCVGCQTAAEAQGAG